MRSLPENLLTQYNYILGTGRCTQIHLVQCETDSNMLGIVVLNVNRQLYLMEKLMLMIILFKCVAKYLTGDRL